MSKRVAMIIVVVAMIVASEAGAPEEHPLWFPGRWPGTIRPRSNKAVTARLPRRSNKAAAAHDRRFRQPQAGGSAVIRFRVHPAVVLADGLRDPLGGADDVRDVPDGERAGDAGAGGRVLLRPVGVPEQLERERRPDAPVPLPGHPRRREPDAAQAR
jgi:hypothetical protein